MHVIGNAKVDGTVRAVASGALSNGAPVVLNSDGTAVYATEIIVKG